jgi:transcriptional regulator of arginine metabolism
VRIFLFWDMQRSDRHELILDLIAVRPISRQDELVRLLTDQGHSVTQASVSRDLERLGITKINGRYVRPSTASFGAFGPLALNTAGDCLIVIRCGSGLASAAAVRIDAAAIPEIVGTIAGDDTIFVAVKNLKDQTKVLKSLRAALETRGNNGNDQN